MGRHDFHMASVEAAAGVETVCYEPAWESIDDLLSSAVAEMAVGEMVTTVNFSLYDAMSSIELMDPHMDAGMAPEKPLLTPEQLPESLTGAQLLAIIDRITATEVAWYDGCPLAQTLFTCLFLHDQCSHIKDEVLHAFATCVLKSCDIARQTIISADIYEEEDFVLESDGFDLLSSVQDAVITKEAQEVEQRISARIKAIKLAIKNESPVNETPQMVPCMCVEGLSEDLRCCELLLAHVTMRRAFLTGSVHLGKPQCKGTKSAAKSFGFAAQQLQIIWTALVDAQSTLPEGAAPEGSPAEIKASDKEEDLPVGFDLRLNRHMLGPSPPRTVGTPGPWPAYSKFKAQLDQMGVVCSVEEHAELASLQQFVRDFSELSANIVVRSWMKKVLMCEWKLFGKIPLDQFIFDHIQSHFQLPDVVLSVPQVPNIMTAITKVINQSFRILCLNPGRQHRSLAISLRDWHVLQQDGEFVDECIRVGLQHMGIVATAHAFSHWVFQQIIAVAAMHARRGIQLELHYPRELQAVYWYSDHFLRLQAQVDTAVLESLQANKQVQEAIKPVPQSSKKKAKDKKKPKETTKDKIKPVKVNPDQLLAEAHRMLFQSLFWVLSVLSFGRLDSQGAPPFGSDQQRFNKRFAPYLMLAKPIPMAFEQYQEHLSAVKQCELPVLLDSSARLLVTAIERLEKVVRSPEAREKIQTEARAELHAASTNLEILKKLKPMVEQEGGLEIFKSVATLDFDKNNVFPTIKLTALK